MTDTTAEAGTTQPDAGEPTTTDSQAAETTVNTEAQAPATESTQTAAPQVPEVYTFDVPEGVTLDKTATDDFSALAKELKLDQATAQKVADVGIKMAQRQQEVFENTKAAWAEQTRADKEFGGDKFDQNMAVALKAIDAFGTPELKELLNVSGLGNHPAVIKFCFKAGKAISPDGFVAGTPASAGTDPAKTMFPSMN